MFNFKDELAKYRESLSVDELSEGLSGDEIQDIFDVAQQLTIPNVLPLQLQERYFDLPSQKPVARPLWG